jgi:hypothetical protein
MDMLRCIFPDVISYLLLLTLPHLLLNGILIYFLSTVDLSKISSEDRMALFLLVLLADWFLTWKIGATILLPLILKLTEIVFLYKLKIRLIVGRWDTSANHCPHLANPLKS